jgi:hypothetical protein
MGSEIENDNCQRDPVGMSTDMWICTGADRCLEGTFVDARDFADETVLLTIEVVRGEDTGSDGSSPRAEFLQCGNDLQVLVQKYPASNL